MKILSKVAAVAIMAAVPVAALAASFEAGESLNITEAIKNNLFAAGQSVSVNHDIAGNLFAAGQSVSVNEPVTQSAFLAGNNVLVNAPVNGDLFAAGQSVILSAPINGDVYAGGQNIILKEGAEITGDLHIGANSLVVESRILGDASISTNSFTLAPNTGFIAGSLALEANGQQPDLQSQVGGEYTFTSVRQYDKDDGRKNENPLTRRSKVGEIYSGFDLFAIFVGLVFAVILAFVFKKPMVEFAQLSRKKVWSSLGIGFLIFIVLPILAIFLAVTIIGLPLSIILALMIPILTIVICILKSWFVGNLILPLTAKSSSWRVVWSWVIGAVIINALPLLGLVGLSFVNCILQAFIFLVALGALYHLKMEYWQVLRKAKKL